MARLDRLPQVRELAQLGSVLGREFAYEMISGLSTLGDTLLQEGLSQLVETELLYQRGRPPRARYIFKHALVQDAAYGSLLRRTRQQTHLQVAELMENRFPGTAEAHPELLAHHLGEAGQPERAVVYWLKAGKRAASSSANRRGFREFHAGPGAGIAAPRRHGPRSLELDLQIALINPVIVFKGYSAPKPRRLPNARSRSAGKQDRYRGFSQAIYGQLAHSYVSGQIARYHELAAEFLDLAIGQPAIVPRSVGHRMVGTASLVSGSMTPAVQHLEQAWALYDPLRDAGSALIYGQDIGTATSSYLGLASVLCGFPDQARDWGHKAVARGQDINHANTLGFALLHAILAAYVTGDRTTAEQHLGQLLLLIEEHNLPVWRASALPMQGSILGWQGLPQDGLVEVERGIEMMARMQFKLFGPRFAGPRRPADRPGAFGRRAGHDHRCPGRYRRTGERWTEAELHRVRGELLLSQFKESEAEAAFTTALTIASEQGAKWWELRTATSLARLWQQQIRLVEARDTLSGVCGWFTEGFDTADLNEAKALLIELAL